MKGSEIRTAFLDFFKARGHEVVKSSSLVPENDPTLLFANAGMNQFKNLFLGSEKRAYTRAATAQKVLRISGKHNDLENVGVTARHHTFFEMLGNFSFGDYFKQGAIEYAWDFITKVLKLPEDRLWVTVFENDDEAAKLWPEVAGVKKERILRCGEKDNFWSMGETGPCGPCTEIYYYIGDKPESQSEAEFRKDDGTYLEFWNLVFMQFDRSKDGKLTPLPRPCVDTGMGLERITSIVQGVKSNYDSDLLRDLITCSEQLSGLKYDGRSYLERDLRSDKAYASDVAMRVIADHSRSMTFLIADGVTPGSDGRGYVLRRLIRRAVRHGRVLGFHKPFLGTVSKQVIKSFAAAYPELVERQELILRQIEAEERKFSETLDAGLLVLQEQVKKVKAGQLFPGDVAFLLHDTYGFPLDLTQDALKAFHMQVDEAAFERAMAGQKSRSREDRKSRQISYTSFKVEAPKTNFLGYQSLAADARVSQIVSADGGSQGSWTSGAVVSVICDATPFYAESGGQVGDTGSIRLKDCSLRVLDTQKVNQDYVVHACEVISGELSSKHVGESAWLEVDASRRQKIRLNHSATHLVHAALRAVLGTHVKQAGSRVDDGSLRFDYSHFAAVTPEQLRDIQAFANEQVRSNHEVTTRVLPIDEAKKTGAIALFGEKYGDVVRVVQMGPQSIEFCGGTHAGRTGDIGFVLFDSEGGVSAGVRRIECVAGSGALELTELLQRERNSLAQLLKSDAHDLQSKIEKALDRSRALEREIEELKSKLASKASGDLLGNARLTPSGIKVIVERVEGADVDTLRSMVDELRGKMGSGVVALGSGNGGSGIVVLGVTPDLIGKYNAGKVVKDALSATGAGRGGGKPDFAQAGGVSSEKMPVVLDKMFELIAAG